MHRAWSAAHGGAADPLRTPIDVAGVTQPGRVVTVEGGAARLAAGRAALLARGTIPRPPAPGLPAPRPPGWGAYVSAPDTEADLGRAEAAVARGLAAGACLVAVGDGTPLTRRLVCEAARLDHGAHAAGRGRIRGQCLRGPGSHRDPVRPRRPDRQAPMSMTEGTVPWPDDLARQYANAGWWRGQDLGAEIAAVAAARPDATALVDGGTRISYASLLARADALAARLARLGLRPGMRIVVQLPNCWPFVVLTLACLRSGIVPVMALPAHRRHELAYLCEHSEARALAVPGRAARLRPPGAGGRSPGHVADPGARPGGRARTCGTRT